MGRPISVSIPHTLGQDEARRRIIEGFSSIQRNKTPGLASLISIRERWEGDRMHFDAGGLGQRVSGRLDILPDSVQIQLDVPDVLAMLADRILAALEAGTQKLLE